MGVLPQQGALQQRTAVPHAPLQAAAAHLGAIGCPSSPVRAGQNWVIQS